MKKIKIFKSGFGEKLKLLLIPIGLLIGSINTAWAYEFDYPVVYFDNASGTDWSNTMFLYYYSYKNSSKGSQGYALKKINNTKLWCQYLQHNRGTDMDYFEYIFGDIYGAWEHNSHSGSSEWNTRKSSFQSQANGHYSGTATTNMNKKTWLCKSTGTSNLTVTEISTDRQTTPTSSTLKFDVTVSIEVDGTSTPTKSPAAISISSYYWSAWDAVTFGGASSNITKGGITFSDTWEGVAYTAATTVEITDLNGDYQFLGWYDEDEYLLSDQISYTFYPREATTVYARFEQRYTIPVSADANGTITTGSPSVSAGYYTHPTITASANSHYIFTGWECTGGATVANSSATTTTVTATADGTVTAKFAPVWAIKGSGTELGGWSTYNGLAYNSTTGKYVAEIELAANTTYEFKVCDRGNSDNMYGYGATEDKKDYFSFIGQNSTCNVYRTDGGKDKNVRIFTAGAGVYTFEYQWSSTYGIIAVKYPTVTHPSSDYIYYYDYDNHASHGGLLVHLWKGDIYTGDDNMPYPSYFSFDGKTFYYAALGAAEEARFAGKDNVDSYKTENLASASSNKGKYYNVNSGATEATRWNAFSQTVTLNNQSATTAGAASVTATYGSAMPSIATNLPEKTGYNFQGYFASTGGSGTKYYNADGTSAHAWDQTGASPQIYAYWTPKTTTVSFNQTGGSGGQTSSVTATYDAAMPTPITTPTLDNYDFAGYWDGSGGTGNQYYDGDGESVRAWDKEDATYTLHAKWDEKLHTVTLANDGHGHIEISSSTETSVSGVGVVTVSAEITAVPATGYKFVNWTGDFGSGVTIASGSTTSATITINATADSKTITANFTEDTYTSENNISRNGGDNDGTYSVTFNDSKIVIEEGNEPVKAGYEVEEYHFTSELNMKIVNQDKSLVSAFSHAEVTYISGGKWVYPGDITIYPKWAPKPYTITLNQQGGSDGSSYFTVTMNTNNYKYGVDEDDEITKPTKTGYTFGGYYTAVDGGGTQIFEINGSGKCVPISGVSGYTAANGNWINTDDDLVLYAYWTPNEYTVTFHSRYGSVVSDVTATYDSDDLNATPVSTKWGNDFGGWFTNTDGTGTEVITSAGALKTGVSGYTDASGNWIHDGDVNLYAKWTPKSNLYWISGDGAGYSSGTSFISAGDNKYYVKVDLNKDDKFHLGDGDAVGGPSSNTTFTLATTEKSVGSYSTYFEYGGTQKQTFIFVLDIYTLKLSFENFVLYKSASDQEGDTHTAYGSETGYDGTIYGDFEVRIPVEALGKWSTLYLPFKPTKVQAWGGTAYHPLFPCHRPTSGKNEGKLMQGYYVIRTPYQAANMSLDRFGEWNDPTDYMEGEILWTPAANTPYIIQWQNSWFIGRYISFWGNDVTIEDEEAFDFGSAPGTDGVVNVLGNGTMSTIGVEGAYVLADDYGSGAWLRGENPEDESTVGPFECYIRANGTTTANTLVIKRRTGDDTTTGWDEILNYETKEVITVYTISGLRVAQYKDCSFEEAGRRMNGELSEGIYILNAGNESVKLIIR